MSTYIELLKDPRWQRKRLEILERDGWACTNCGDTETTLHVDHRFYEFGKKPWEYDGSALQTLCEPCHKREGVLRSAMKAVLRADEDKSRIVGYAQALAALRDGSSFPLESHEHATGVADALGVGLVAEDLFEYFGYEHDARPLELAIEIARGRWTQRPESAAAAARHRKHVAILRERLLKKHDGGEPGGEGQP